MVRKAGSYLEGQPVISVFGAACREASVAGWLIHQILVAWRRPLAGKKTDGSYFPPATFLWLIAATGTLLVATHPVDPVNLFAVMFLDFPRSVPACSGSLWLGGLRTGLWRPGTCRSPRQRASSPMRNIPRRTARRRRRQQRGVRPSPSGTPWSAGDQDVSLTLRPGTITTLNRPVNEVDTGHPAGSIPR